MTRDVLSFLTGKITSSELGQELLEEIDAKASQDAVDAINKQMEESLKELDQSVADLDSKLEDTSGRLEQVQNDLKMKSLARWTRSTTRCNKLRTLMRLWSSCRKPFPSRAKP